MGFCCEDILQARDTRHFSHPPDSFDGRNWNRPCHRLIIGSLHPNLLTCYKNKNGQIIATSGQVIYPKCWVLVRESPQKTCCLLRFRIVFEFAYRKSSPPNPLVFWNKMANRHHIITRYGCQPKNKRCLPTPNHPICFNKDFSTMIFTIQIFRKTPGTPVFLGKPPKKTTTNRPFPHRIRGDPAGRPGPKKEFTTSSPGSKRGTSMPMDPPGAPWGKKNPRCLPWMSRWKTKEGS